MYKIEMEDVEVDGLSMIDEIGKVFHHEGGVYRGIFPNAIKQARELLTSGLIEELERNQLFPGTKEADFVSKEFPLILKHAKIDPVTYPYEWSFSMLKSAARTIIKVNRIANKYGYELKDCHPYNIIFEGTIPKFVDFGSFVKIKAGRKGWVSYKDFHTNYLHILELASRTDFSIVPKLLAGIGDFSHGLYYYIKYPLLRVVGFSILKKVATMRYTLNHGGGLDQIKRKIPTRYWNILGPICHFLARSEINYERLIERIDRLPAPKVTTLWTDYHSNNYTADGSVIGMSKRFVRIKEIVSDLGINHVFEIAGNQGAFARYLIEEGKATSVICSDYDANAVDQMYLRNAGSNALTPVLLNFYAPHMKFNTAHPAKRFRAELVLALAITHHLVLSQGISLPYFLAQVRHYCQKYVIIEFMPLGLFDGRTAPRVPEWYNVEWFRENFTRHFEILLEEKLEPNRIMFLGRVNSN